MSYERDSKGIKSILERFLLTNQLMAIEFNEGFIFGRVVRRRICHYMPWNLIDGDGNAVDISADSHQDELRFLDPRNTGDDILYLSDKSNMGYPWILHGSIGIGPEQILMYPKFPEGKTIPGKFPNVGPIKPSAGEYLGYVSSRQSPYRQPTDYYEYVIPPGIHIAAEYYNQDDDRSHQPRLNLLFAVYWFQILDLTTNPDLVQKISLRRVPATFLTVGFGDAPENAGEKLLEEWGKAIDHMAHPLSLDEAARGG